MTDRIYLDHAATTPLRPEAEAAMNEGFSLWANPSSPHAEGRAARRALEDARSRVAAALDWQGEVIFTSGASEAAELALTRAKGGARLVSAVEHDAVLKAAPTAERLTVRPNGALDMESFREAVRREKPVVAVQTINSETGNRQDTGAVASLIHAEDGLLLADASQSAGKEALPPSVDMAIVSAHKLGGPVGIGALLLRDFAMLEPAGGQERGYRRGTENLPAVLGFAAALEACGSPYLQDGVEDALGELAETVRGAGGVWMDDRLSSPTPYVSALAMPNMSASAQLMRFDMVGFAVSQGSACSSGSLKTSHVLEAMALDEELASRMIRVSPGWTTTPKDVRAFAEAWRDLQAKGGR
jgi:cysteine desulfurase